MLAIKQMKNLSKLPNIPNTEQKRKPNKTRKHEEEKKAINIKCVYSSVYAFIMFLHQQKIRRVCFR